MTVRSIFQACKQKKNRIIAGNSIWQKDLHGNVRKHEKHFCGAKNLFEFARGITLVFLSWVIWEKMGM